MLMKIDTTLADRYQICELLSQKAGRLTFLARDLLSQTLVIVKILRFDRDFQWDDLKLFEREAATLKNLDCPEIPKYLDYFEVDEADTRGFALVQSYLEAPSLATLIANGRRFSEAEVIELADRLLAILTYLHEQHPPLIHRDLKPSNILLTNRSSNSISDVYLVDFGSVQTAARKEEGTITIVGSYGYMPLEQFGGQTTMASDLYSLGMTLIYLLTGTHPAELPQVDGRVKFTAEISKKFERWLDKMTQPHLDKRFDSAKIARVALNSEDGSYGDFDRLKPADTQIQLYRDRDKLEITWSEYKLANNLESLYTYSAIGFVACLFLAIISFASKVPLSVLVIFFFFSPVLLLCLRTLFLYLSTRSPKILKILLGKRNYRLVIDDIYICKLRDRGQKSKAVKLTEHSRSQFEILAYNPGYTFDKCVDTNGKLIQGSNITIPPKLYLYCGGFEYSFPAQFSQAELWWLGNELSDFLNLELQVIYPTPKVPPVPSCGGGC
jgi:serine/threonine protein kinase